MPDSGYNQIAVVGSAGGQEIVNVFYYGLEFGEEASWSVPLRGAFLAAVEDGKAQRYPEDPAKAVPELVELLKTVAPTLTRAAAAGGGPPPPRERQTTAPARAIWNIGNRTDNNSGN